jgi:hypothetical protein
MAPHGGASRLSSHRLPASPRPSASHSCFYVFCAAQYTPLQRTRHSAPQRSPFAADLQTCLLIRTAGQCREALRFSPSNCPGMDVALVQGSGALFMAAAALGNITPKGHLRWGPVKLTLANSSAPYRRVVQKKQCIRQTQSVR